jgi:hypothetical protein
MFRSAHPARDKYLSRLFGLFSEDVVRYWCSSPEARYENLGRPTLTLPDAPRGSTIDFTFRARGDNHLFVGELKCELEYENYRYLRLESPSQLVHHQSVTAFAMFLQAARQPNSLRVRVAGKPQTISGAILVWGATSDEGVKSVSEAYGFADILSVETMLDDLRAWRNPGWTNRVRQVRSWSDELFSYLE